MKYIKFVDFNGISYKEKTSITVEDIGEKGVGLLFIPDLWTMPFFIVSQRLFSSFIESNEKAKSEIIKQYVHHIKQCCECIGVLGNDEIIIRSSGVHEGMSERGQLESIITTNENIEVDIKNLLNRLIKISTSSIPFIIQKYVKPVMCGHMSNERRFSYDRRDWHIEFYKDNSFFDDDGIAIRYWRAKPDADQLSKNNLFCNSSIRLTNTLRAVATYWFMKFKKGKRFHLEFVWDGQSIYVVQADEELPVSNAIDPKSIAVNIPSNVSINNEFKVLKTIDLKSLSMYNKLSNVNIYHNLGLKTVPLYLLEGSDIIQELKSGVIRKELTEDLKVLMTIRPIVIRTNIITNNKEDSQLSPRSDDINDYNVAKEWLVAKTIELSENTNVNSFVFIIHNFIPARASAFAHVSPSSRTVEIQSLWGLPEGLYYNSHDTTIVDLQTKDINSIPQKVTIKKKSAFKDFMVYANPSGSWESVRITPPCDWGYSITNAQIKEIAISSHKIANSMQKELSIMWFVGIDKNYYGIDCIPWYHEEVNLSTYTPDKYKRKYFFKEEHIIKSVHDLNALPKNGETIKCLRIKPVDDTTLRDKEFIEKVGNFAKTNNIRILLEGARLAHSFYQLTKTGATVVCTRVNEFDYTNEHEFNKLVRDRIPEKITLGGEIANCRKADGKILNTLLLEKLYEECFELIDAVDENEIIEEIADIFEVCDAIKARFENNEFLFIPRTNKKKSSIRGGELFFSSTLNNLILNTHDSFNLENIICTIDIKREKGIYKVDINLHLKEPFAIKEKKESTERYSKRTPLIICVSKLLGNPINKICITDINEVLAYVDVLLKQMLEGEKKCNETKKNKIRKNGAFADGLVLLGTKLPSAKISNQLSLEIENEGQEVNYPRLNYFPHKKYKFSDCIDNKSRLFFRTHIPMGVREWEVEFFNDNLLYFVNGYDCLIFKIWRESEKILYNISLKNESVRQEINLDEVLKNLSILDK